MSPSFVPLFGFRCDAHPAQSEAKCSSFSFLMTNASSRIMQEAVEGSLPSAFRVLLSKDLREITKEQKQGMQDNAFISCSS